MNSNININMKKKIILYMYKQLEDLNYEQNKKSNMCRFDHYNHILSGCRVSPCSVLRCFDFQVYKPPNVMTIFDQSLEMMNLS